MKKLLAAVFVFAAACASTDAPEPLPPVTPPPDPRVGELQTTLTELLERIDVLNERMARLENGVAATPVVVSTPASAPAQVAVPQTVAVPTREGGPSRVQPELPPVPASQPALVSAKLAEDYRQAIILFGRGRHSDARRSFQEVFEADTNGDLADNALFWIGETYYAAGDYSNAVRFYMRVVNDYAEENKAPDALLKVALAQERTGDLALARKTLQRVIERYPYSSTASTAKSELQRIRY
ncbi:MAG TPA: tol-pal system protein YbgF [Thermoanaerobaculia bacterium]